MFLTLYKTLDGDNVINKTLTEPTEISIILKSDFDVTNPTIILENILGVEYSDFNYCFISEINYFYFVRNVQFLNNKCRKLILELDYVETYKTEILNSDSYYYRKIQVGDYGELKVEKTGKEITEHYFSNVELPETNDSILSVLRN